MLIVDGTLAPTRLPCLLDLERADGAMEMSVRDSEATLPVPRSPDPGRVGQHDLEIVIALCQSFEMRREPTGKRIKPPSHSPTAPSEAQQAKSSDRIPPHPPVGCPGDLARQVVVEADDHLQRGERLVLAVDRPQRVRHFEDRSSLAFRSTSAADWPA